ncbi:hypothetical protein HanRHA438_Chr15g0720601 [Helianthus annuus]|nr:hypothetical protein HanRHA438_Chr15g0720601 [Helianthus annuus]
MYNPFRVTTKQTHNKKQKQTKEQVNNSHQRRLHLQQPPPLAPVVLLRRQPSSSTLADSLPPPAVLHRCSTEFTCRVEVKRIRNSQEWFRLTCGGGNCMKGVGREDNDMWCDGCENPVVFPIGRLITENKLQTCRCLL